MAGNTALNNAAIAKKDEFYTQLTDIEKEMRHYKEHFKDKVIFCNCDDPEESNFWKYFELNFEELGLKKLVATHFETEKPSYKLELTADINGDEKITNKDIVKTPLRQNGDFRSPECIEIMKKSDIVVTNPPFSLFREYLAQLMEYQKKFIIIGGQNAITYKEVFPLIQENKIWTGNHCGYMEFVVPPYYTPRATGYREKNGVKYCGMGNICWFTNLDIEKRHEDMTLFRNYTEEEYPKYANYDAIEVSRVSDIPCDYDGEMGVPITFLFKYNPDQFEIVGSSRWLGRPMSEIAEKGTYVSGGIRFYLPLDKNNETSDNFDKTRQDKTRQDKTRQDKTRQDKTRQYRCLYDRIVIKRRKISASLRPDCD